MLPHINPFAFEEEANSGDSVQLTCHVSKGDLPLTIKWLHNNKQMYSHLGVMSNKIGDRISLLTIAHVKDQNSGEYKCRAENAAGSTNYTTTLFVNGAYKYVDCFYSYRHNFPIELKIHLKFNDIVFHCYCILFHFDLLFILFSRLCNKHKKKKNHRTKHTQTQIQKLQQQKTTQNSPSANNPICLRRSGECWRFTGLVVSDIERWPSHSHQLALPRLQWWSRGENQNQSHIG